MKKVFVAEAGIYLKNVQSDEELSNLLDYFTVRHTRMTFDKLCNNKKYQVITEEDNGVLKITINKIK